MKPMRSLCIPVLLLLSMPLVAHSRERKPNPPFAGEIPEDAFVFEGTGEYGGTLVLAAEGNPKSFNPHLANETSTTEITSGPLFTSLVGYNYRTLESEPALAKSWEISPDNLSYTFHLRRGVRWSDGAPFNADDVVFNYQVVTDPKILTSTKDLFRQSDGTFPKLTKIDDYTVRFDLSEVNVLFVDSVGSLYILPRHKLEKAYRAGKFMQSYLLDVDPADIVTTGPYRLKSFANEQRVVLERNPYYWKVDKEGKRLPYIDRVIFVVVPDFDTSFLKFRNREVHMRKSVRPEEVDLLMREQERGNFTLYDLGPALSVNNLVFNQHTGVSTKTGKPYLDPIKQKWFRNIKFRQAVSYAIDRESLVQTVFAGRATPIYQITSPGNKRWFNPNTKKYPYDPEKAKALLAEEGFLDRDGDGILEDSEGNRVEFRLETNSENSTRVQMATFIRENLQKIGMKVNLRPVPFNQLVAALQDSHDWEAIILGWASGVPPDPAMSKNILLSSGRSHQWFPMQEKPSTEWEARIDALIRKNTQTLDFAERKKTYDEIQAIWAEVLPEIELVATNHFSAVRNCFGNLYPSVLRPHTYWNIEELYFTNPRCR